MEKTTRKIDGYTDRWYIVCTAAKAEKKVKKLLEQSGFECYLPLQSVVRMWNNRRKRVMTPIISGIVFVCLSKDEVLETAALRDVSLLLKREGCCVSVSDEQLRLFRNQIESTDGFIESVFDDLLSVD